MVKYTLMLLGTALLRLIPLKLAYSISTNLADLCHILLRQRRNTLKHNFSTISGETLSRRQLHRLSKSTFRNIAKATVDFLRFPLLSKEEILSVVEAEGIERLRKALAKKKGVILVTPHLGNWDFGGAVLAALGFPINAVTETIAPKRGSVKKQMIGGLYREYRTRVGMKVLPLESSPVGIYRALKKDEVVVFVADRDITGSGLEVTFLNRKMALPKGPAFFSLKTGAPIVPSYLVRKDRSYLGVVEEPIDSEGVKDLTQLTQRIAQRLESQIRRYPDQWFVFERL